MATNVPEGTPLTIPNQADTYFWQDVAAMPPLPTAPSIPQALSSTSLGPPRPTAPSIPQALSSTSLGSIPQLPYHQAPLQPATVAPGPPVLPVSVLPTIPVDSSSVSVAPPLPPPSIAQGLSSANLRTIAPPSMPPSLQPMRSQTTPHFEFLPQATSEPVAMKPPASRPVEDRGVLVTTEALKDADPLLDSANVPGKGEYYGATGTSTYINPPNEDWRDYVQESKGALEPTSRRKYRYGFYPPSIARYCGLWSLLVLLPWMIFTVIVASLVFAYHRHALSVCFIVLLFLGMAVLFAVLGVTNRRNSFVLSALGALCAFATFSACLVGLWGYHKVSAQYYRTDESRTYTDVLPGEPAVAHADAGTLIFSTDSRVDLGKVVGYKTTGAVYCVAPILKKDPIVSSRVEYWAAGTDCCHARSGFSCGDAWQRHARVGMVLPEALPSKSWLFPGSREQYLKAAEEAAGVYGLLLGEEPLFVTWARDIPETRRDMWHWILAFVFAASGIYFCFACLCAVVAYLANRPSPSNNSDEEFQVKAG